MKIVFDTNVLLSALATHGLSYRVLDICLDKHQLFISKWIIDETSEKLNAKFNVSQKDIRKAQKFFRNEFTLINPGGDLPKACRDKDDNNILHLAEHVQADLIITGDKDLLTLKKYKETLIINPRTFIEEYN